MIIHSCVHHGCINVPHCHPMQDLGWREISSMLWALATLRLIPTLRANSSNSSSSLNSNATDASNSQTPTTDVTHKSAQAASASIIGSAPELTSNPKSGQAGSTRQDRQQSDWVSAALARLQALGSARADPQSLSNTAWALGKLGIAPSKGWLDDYLKVRSVCWSVWVVCRRREGLWLP
jgi:hypothetical protein